MLHDPPRIATQSACQVATVPPRRIGVRLRPKWLGIVAEGSAFGVFHGASGLMGVQLMARSFCRPVGAQPELSETGRFRLQSPTRR